MNPEAARLPQADEPDRSADFARTREDLSLWRNGDSEAFERIWARYRRGLEMLIRRRVSGIRNGALRNRIPAEDVLQDAMVTVVKKLKDFEYGGPGSLYAWMEAVAIHQVTDWVDHWEATKRSPRAERPLPGPQPDTVGASPEPRTVRPGPSTELASREERDRVATAVASLPERDFKLVLVRQYFGGDWGEVATAVGAPSADAARKQYAKVLAVLPGLMQRN